MISVVKQRPVEGSYRRIRPIVQGIGSSAVYHTDLRQAVRSRLGPAGTATVAVNAVLVLADCVGFGVATEPDNDGHACITEGSLRLFDASASPPRGDCHGAFQRTSVVHVVRKSVVRVQRKR